MNDFTFALRRELNRTCTSDLLGLHSPATHSAADSGRGPTRFPGICSDAVALGVNRRTLHRALKGDWHLPGLLARYHALKRKQLKEAA
jgi:hypothetical protein